MQALWFKTALLPGGWADGVRVTHEGGLIASVESGLAPAPGDERAPIGIPGLANVHSHAFQRGMAGLAERRGPADDDFWTWREVMYRFLAALDPDDMEAIAALAYAEMLESGFSRVGEFHYLHNDAGGCRYANPAEMAARIAAAAARTGMGLTLLPVFYAHADFGGAPAKAGQRRFITDLEGFARLLEASRAAVAGLPDAGVGVAPHSLRAATPAELAFVAALAPDGPIHIHAAEQTGEVDACVAWSGRRPVEWLLEHAGVDARWCLIHATHLTDREADGLAASGAVAGLCPITEADLGDGVFPAARYLTAGGAVGIGTDSNVMIDAGGELRALEYAQRLVQRSRNVLAGAQGASVGAALFAAALAGGARALAADGRGIAPGAPADIVSLDGDHPSLIGRAGDDLLDGWIFAAGRQAIASVWRRGRKVVAGGRHVERARIVGDYRRVLKKVLA